MAEKVGQLFLVTFQGTDVSSESDIATLVRDYRVGGVVLLPANDNFRSVPITMTVTSPDQSQKATQTNPLSTPQQVAHLTNALQALVMNPARPITTSVVITPSLELTTTVPITTSGAATTTMRESSETPRSLTQAQESGTGQTPTPTPLPTEAPTTTVQAGKGSLHIPLLIGMDWTGDDSSFFSGTGGFTPLPSAMAVGATWSPELAEKVGQVVGQELQAVGINLLLGPTLDVLDVPRPGKKGDLDVRTFGGDPYWVGQMGQAFIRGVQAGSQEMVATAAKHFPGQGGSDRRPEDEVATVQKSVAQLRQIELAPFATVTAGGDLGAPGITAAMMTSHIRYRGFQGNIRQLTPPISMAPELQDLMALDEFAAWRAAGGVLISDALGVPAVRRYYDPRLQKFPDRQVAQDAFLAGNDLLFLSRFALTDNWPDQFAAIKETILFFQSKYQSDGEFRARVDDAVKRIIGLKLRIYGGDWSPNMLQRDAANLDEQVGHSESVTQAVARAGLTLIYPGRDELADRMPTAPLAKDKILIVTDARTVSECTTCKPAALISPTALEEIMLRLYGPHGTGQISPENIRSLTFTDLNQLLADEPGQHPDIEEAITNAQWIIFAQLDYNPDEYPGSTALRNFLAKRSDSLRNKRLVVMAFRAPYYLDTTEISKLTAYFGVYSKTTPFLEAAVRALFREFSPVSAPPVTVTGINYELIRQLEPAAGQIISLAPIAPMEEISGSIQVGSVIPLETGVILDRNGHPVPDGTPVEFYLSYPTESLELAPVVVTTVAGRARTEVDLDRPGELWITAQSGEAKDSTRIEFKVGGDTPGSIATVVPSPTTLPTATPTHIPPPTSTPTVTPVPSPIPSPTVMPTSASLPPKRRVTLPAFLYALVGTLLAGGTVFGVHRRYTQTDQELVQAWVAVLWAVASAWVAYLLYAFGWLPGATRLQVGGHTWVAGAITLAGGLLALIRWWPSKKDIGDS